MRDKAIINIDKTDIRSCYEDKCAKANLFEFTSIIDKYVSDFIDYKIEINKV